MPVHPLTSPPIVRAVELAASAHLGKQWQATGFTNLDDRASHPAGILHGRPLSVFAKFDHLATGAEQFTAELHGLEFLRRNASVETPYAIGAEVLRLEEGTLLLLEAIREVPAQARSAEQWRSFAVCSR